MSQVFKTIQSNQNPQSPRQINQKPKLKFILLALLSILVILIISIISFPTINSRFNPNSQSSKDTNSNQQSSSATIIEDEFDPNSQQTTPETPNTQPPSLASSDPLGIEISYRLQLSGYNLGFVHSQAIKDLGLPVPFNPSEDALKSKITPETPLNSIAQKPTSPEFKNRLEYPRFGIVAPIQYADFYDLFGTNEAGDINFQADPGLRNYGVESPVQIKLQDGVAHMGFSPMPGEIGNSYIVGHTSNYAYIKSDYNTIFAPLVYKTNNGDEFIIYDSYGRKLIFRVFESLAIREEDTATAYKIFPGRRVVTLQGSILEKVNGQNLPTKRWLVRGELVL